MENLFKIVLAGIISLTGGWIFNDGQEANHVPFTIEEASKIALEKVDGNIVSQEDDNDDYEFMIEKDGYSYFVEVDKQTQQVTEVDKKKNNETSQPTQNQSTSITLEEAKEIALNKVNGEIIHQSQDDDDYEFKIKKDNYIYEIDVNKFDGEIEDFDKEEVKTESTLSKNQARELALQKVNGKIVKEDIDDHEYEFEIQLGDYLYEVEDNKTSQKAVITDKESIRAEVQISQEQAKQIALQKVNGEIIDIELDVEDCEYSVEIIDGQDEYLRNRFIEKYKPFLAKYASQVCHRYLQYGESDELSIALIAFNESIDRFDGSSSFFEFSKKVVKSRLYDYMNSKSYRESHHIISFEDDIGQYYLNRQSMDSYHIESRQDYLKEEIEQLQKVLKYYQITIVDVYESRPKHLISRQHIHHIISCMLKHPQLISKIIDTGQLPMKSILEICKTTRKRIEPYRKYIVAVIVIYEGQFELLQEYLPKEVIKL